jgi:hypothetical protein
MKKKIDHGTPEGMRDWWRNRAHSTWKKLSAGAAQIARMIPYGHKDCWRRKDKVQPGHNPPGHKCHKDK